MTPHEQEIRDMTAKSCAVALRAFEEGAPDYLVVNCFRSAAEVARFNLPDYVAKRFQGFAIEERPPGGYSACELGEVLLDTLIEIYAGGSC